jgi:protease I
MEFGLKGRHVAVLAAEGVDGQQLAAMGEALRGAGALADVLAADSGHVRGAGGETLDVERTLEVCHAADYHALIIPGGRQSVEALGKDRRAVQLVREFMAADKPVAAIGDGVRLLIMADTVAGRTVAAPADVADEVRDAGGTPVDAALNVDEKLITARTGGDPRALNEAIVREFSNRVDEARVDELSEQSFPASDPPPGPVSVGGEGASRASHLDPRATDRKGGLPSAGTP